MTAGNDSQLRALNYFSKHVHHREFTGSYIASAFIIASTVITMNNLLPSLDEILRTYKGAQFKLNNLKRYWIFFHICMN